MELYKRFPKVSLIWCSIEVALYAGQIYGWSALIYVLKDEGFYADYCETYVATNSLSDKQYNIAGHLEWNTTLNNSKTAYLLADPDTNRTYLDNTIVIRTLDNDSLADSIGPETRYPYKNTEQSMEEDEDDTFNSQQYTPSRHEQYLKNCAIQDSRLNLWFSIGVAFSCVMCGFLGPLMRKIGMRFYRLFFL